MPSTTTCPPKPLVYSLDALQPEALALARKHFDLIAKEDGDVEGWIDHAQGLLVRESSITGVQLRSAKSLTYLAKHGVGVDKIDVTAAKDVGIHVMNTPGVNAVAVAELAVTLVLAVARKVATIDRKIRSGEHVTKLAGWDGLTIQGRTVGILGGGNIGLAVARMFHYGFGCPILLYDPYLSPAAKSLWESTIPSANFSMVSDLEKGMYPHADIISLHIPLLPSTTDLIGHRQLQLMKPSTILINTARGGIITESDLIEALRSNTIYGAGLDAFVTEPPTLSAYKSLAELDNVVMTPHIGAGNADTQRASSLSMVQHLVDALIHRKPKDMLC